MRPDSNFILSITPNYAYGRRQGFTVEETYVLAEEAYSLMQIAEEKQVPKKPNGFNDECWDCGEFLSAFYDHPNYCPNCGNKVDWGNEDET